MGKRTPFLSIVAVVSVALVAACADGGRTYSTAPKAGPASSNLLGGAVTSLTSLLIAPVERTTPLANDVTWSFTVGPSGAVSGNSAAGLIVTVPSGALSSVQTITVTALAGKPVAYRFAPHGLVFDKDVSLSQSLVGTSVSLLALPVLSGAYFATDNLQLTANGLAQVTEIIPATVNPLTRRAVFPIRHFSGYILASGRGSREDEQ